MTKPLNIQFPRGGISRKFAFQSQPPYTTPDALNVVPMDAIGERFRGGNRWGLSKAINSRVSEDGPVWNLNTITDNSTGTMYLTAVAGAASAPVLKQYSSGTWNQVPTTGPTTFAFPSTSNYVVNSCYDTIRVSNATALPDRLIFGCHGWDHSYSFDQSDFLITEEASVRAFASMKYYGGLWHLQRPRQVRYTDIFGSIGPGTALALLFEYGSQEPWTGCLEWFANYGMLFTATESLLLINGITNRGGKAYLCTDRFGMVSPSAWCKGAMNYLYVLSGSGLVRFDPGSPSSAPTLIAHESMPAILRGLDTSTYHVRLVYDARHNGIHIFISKISATAGLDHWYLDLYQWEDTQRYGWWPMQYPTNCEPFSVCTVSSTPSGLTDSVYTDILLGCRDGYVRRLDPTVATDDGTAISSSLVLGPFCGSTLGDAFSVESVRASLAAGSGTVNLSLRVGDSGEGAYNASAFGGVTKALGAGFNKVWRPLAKGNSAYLVMSSTEKWGYESIGMETSPYGDNNP